MISSSFKDAFYGSIVFWPHAKRNWTLKWNSRNSPHFFLGERIHRGNTDRTWIDVWQNSTFTMKSYTPQFATWRMKIVENWIHEKKKEVYQAVSFLATGDPVEIWNEEGRGWKVLRLANEERLIVWTPQFWWERHTRRTKYNGIGKEADWYNKSSCEGSKSAIRTSFSLPLLSRTDLDICLIGSQGHTESEEGKTLNWIMDPLSLSSYRLVIKRVHP